MANNQQQFVYLNGQQRPYGQPFTGQPGVDSMFIMSGNTVLRQPMVMPGGPVMVMNNMGVPQIFPPTNDFLMRQGGTSTTPQYIVQPMMSYPQQSFPPRPPGPGGPQAAINVQQVQHQHGVNFNPAQAKTFQPGAAGMLPQQQQQQTVVYTGQPGNFVAPQNAGAAATGAALQFAQPGRPFNNLQQQVQAGAKPNLQHGPPNNAALDQVGAQAVPQNGSLPNAAQPQVAVPGYPAVNANPHQAGAQVQMPLTHGLSQGPPNNQINSGPAAGNGRSIIVSVANVMDTQNAPSNQNAASAQPAATTVSGTNMSATQSAPYSTTGVPVADAAAGELGGSGPNKARYGNDRLYIPPGPASTAAAVPISQPPIVAVGIDAQHMEVHTIPAPQPATNMPPKRERKPLMIVNPDTNKVIDTEMIERERKERESREKQQTATPASESQSATHLPSTQSIVITNPVTNAVVHVARTPRSSVSESASKHSLTSQRAEVPASLESGNVSTAVKQETVAVAARDEPRQKAEAEPVATTLAMPSKAATLEKQAVATPAPAEAPTQEATKVAAVAVATPVAAAAVVDNQEREEGELDKTLDASVSESTGKPGVKLVLACDVVVERTASGRWNYDRDTLMKLRPSGVAPQLAMEFGALEQRTPRSAGVMHGRQSFQGPRSTADTFMPDFMWAPGMTPGPAFTKGMPGMSRGGSYQGARAGKKPMVIEPPPAVAVTLHRVDNAYVPNCVKTQQELSTESELDKLRRKLLSILNKITPQKFRQLMMRTFELISAVSTPDMLESVVNIIFEKAIAEPNFSVAYSHVCRHLMDVNVPNATNADRPVTFKFLLISKCQKEFEKKGDAPMQEQIKQRYDEINAEPNEEKRTQMRAEVDDIMSKARRRSLGNTKFIGELFKLEILTDTIVYFCLQHYLREGDDDSLECLCKLLITIGKKLESNQKFKDRFNEIFNRIKKIVDEKGCSLRLRCLLQDVLDLRLNDWKPRREEGGPKTIDQIHADAQREETERAMYSQFSQFSTPRGGGNQAGEFREDLPTRGSNRRGRDEAGAAANLFAIPSSASSSKLQNASDADADSQMPYRRGSAKPGGQQALEPATTIKLPTATVNAGEVRLGPGAPRKAWGAGSQQAQPAAAASATSSATQSKDSRTTGKQPLPATKQGSGGAWRTPNSGPDQRDLPPNRSAIGAPNEKWSSQPASFAARVANREQTDAAQSGASSNTGSRDATPDRRGSVPHAGNTNAQSRLADAQSAASGRGADIGIGSGARVDEELQSKRAASTLRDYMEVNCRLLPELVTDLVDMCRAANCDQFVRLLVNEAFEQRGSDRDDHTNARLSCGRLLADMFQQRLLNSTVFTNGLKAVAQDAPDQELDLPRVYDYFAEVLAETVRSADDQLILNCFADILEPLRDIKKSASVFISIFKQLERRLGKDETERLWRSSRLDVSSFIERGEADSILKSNNLSYLVGSSDAPKFNVEDPLQFGKQLTSSLEQLLRGGKTNDQIVDWVEANVKNLVSVSELLYAHFVRALVTAVTSSAVQKIRNASTSQAKLDPEVLKLRYDLLNKYIDHKHERELHALCALQLHDVHLAHPSGVLNELFYELSDNDIISDDAFRDWNNKKEPHEDVGFGVARTAVRQFIAQLGTD